MKIPISVKKTYALLPPSECLAKTLFKNKSCTIYTYLKLIHNDTDISAKNL